MRLEKIVLNGFKSFADKTEFSFEWPVTAIVGPNGCGKSNVVDAVKWVLGEQSVKSLRSDQMADVIFSGSSSRKPLGSAEVELFISNSARQMPVETDHVQISRRIFGSGESEYRINNKICRLRDIRELFMDTGVGTRAYSIIEQGQVEHLLNASKTDRRVIFEEAAGVSKYKAHKKQALRKLEQTHQNLLRLADILGEVTKRLRSVKLQAGKARNYLQYTEQLKQVQLNYSLAEFNEINCAVQQKKTALDEANEKFAAVAAQAAADSAEVAKLGEQVLEIDARLNRIENCLVSVKSRIDQHLQRIEFLRSRFNEIHQHKTDTSARMEKLNAQKKVFQRDLAQYKAELAECEKQLLEKTCQAAQLEKTIQLINAECSSLQADLQDEKSGIIDIVRSTAQLHNEIQSISVYRSNLSTQKQRLTGRAQNAQAELETLLTDKAGHKARLADIEKVLGELQESLSAKRSQTDETDLQIAQASRRLTHSRETRSALTGEMTILSDMETRREGLNNAVKGLLQRRSVDWDRFDYIEGILADIIVADVKYANAVEAALEGKTDSIVVNCTSRLLADRRTIDALDGRVNFICADNIEPFADNSDFTGFDGVSGRVAEFVRSDSRYAPLVWKLLGKTLLVDTLDCAADLAPKFGKEYGFVTLEGQVVCAGDSIRLGPLGKTTGLISRKSRLRQLQDTIASVESEIAQIEADIDQKQLSKTHLVKLCKDLRTAVYEANTEKMQAGSALTVIEQNIHRLTQEQPLISGEITLLQEQIEQSVQKEYNSKQRLQELEVVNSQRCAHIEELETRYAHQKSQQQFQADKLTDLKVAVGQFTEHRQAVIQTVDSLQNQVSENLAACRTAETEIDSSSRQLAQAQSDILSAETAVSDLFVEKDRTQQDRNTLQSHQQQLCQQRKCTEEILRQKLTQQDQIEESINLLRIELGQLEVKRQSLAERVQEQMQVDLYSEYQRYEHKQVDWEKVRAEIAELRGRIERLGNVNIDAIAEQEVLENRSEFLTKQVEDLNSSRGQLQQLIIRLNKISREKFETTFEQIRVHFQQIFRKLFGGGRADITLETAPPAKDPAAPASEVSDDILDAGIEITARPPGKETRSISLLSGGEKAMTAIALLFAVFKAKPSPFCFLDEIDAALDEANNERFNLLIRQFQQDTQFIVITHAKRTMSLADVLYGVTMQTRGVSKKISVRFEEYEPAPDTVAVA